MHFLVIGNPENRRSRFFQEAVAALPGAKAEVLSYEELLQHPGLVSGKIQGDTWVRIESPGENFQVRKGLIALGAKSVQEQAGSFIDAETARALEDEPSRIAHGRQWYHGFQTLLSHLQESVAPFPQVKWMNATKDILTMFDKVKCHQHFCDHAVSVPKALYDIPGFEMLKTALNASGMRKVFIKPAHGSSASGVMAFRFSETRMELITSVELVKEKGEPKLFNSLKIRKYTAPAEIEILLNTIAREKIIVEEWIPKASIGNKVFDLRVLVIGGEARHAVVRTSNHPLTNLHLGNKRAGINDLEKWIGVPTVEAVKALAEKAAASFPASLYIGMDVLVSHDLSRIKILEANAFGDLLPGILHRGESTYEAEVKAMLRKIPLLCQ